MFMLRDANFEADAAAILAIDRSFVTAEVFRLKTGALGLELERETLPAPLAKTFPLGDLNDPDRPYDRGWVLEAGDRCVGFAATSFEAWNSRLIVWHFYVDAKFRRRGGARQLMQAVLAEGRGRGARHVWLETSSANPPGFAAYRALGFALTGIDRTLYDGTPAEGEVALFVSRPLAQKG
jgi:ribosomal protein S18 acetylase RimI-like enzyme